MIVSIPELESEADYSTRVSGYKVIQDISKFVPHYVSESAYLNGSTGNYIDKGGNLGVGFEKTYSGKNLYFGIHDHGMGSIMNGFSYHSLFNISGSTFPVFMDYFRPTVCVAGLVNLNHVFWILTNDSIGTQPSACRDRVWSLCLPQCRCLPS